MSEFSSGNVRYLRYQDTNVLKLWNKTAFPIPSLNAVNAISIITTQRCHYEIIQNEGPSQPLKPLEDKNLSLFPQLLWFVTFSVVTIWARREGLIWKMSNVIHLPFFFLKSCTFMLIYLETGILYINHQFSEVWIIKRDEINLKYSFLK